ncbi:MAG: hypothetical protein JO172_07485 [Hyphomicrobiales bacterium]|nr:hypothetical protein [Hyphomicrobiales bacterium]
MNFVEVEALSQVVAPVFGSREQSRVWQQSCTFNEFAASMQLRYPDPLTTHCRLAAPSQTCVPDAEYLPMSRALALVGAQNIATRKRSATNTL